VIAALLDQLRQPILPLGEHDQGLLADLQAVLQHRGQLGTTLGVGVVDLRLQPQQRTSSAGITVEPVDEVADPDLQVRNSQTCPLIPSGQLLGCSGVGGTCGRCRRVGGTRHHERDAGCGGDGSEHQAGLDGTTGGRHVTFSFGHAGESFTGRASE
jgi:hypothetical protein